MDSQVYIVLVAGRYHAVTASRFLFVAGRIVPVEGEDEYGNRFAINSRTLVRVGVPRSYKRGETQLCIPA